MLVPAFAKPPDHPAVWCLIQGRRRHLTDPGWFARHGVPPDIQQISLGEIERIPLGPPCPQPGLVRDRPLAEFLAHPALMRQFLGAMAVGNGIECGPGRHPLPIPLESSVRFIDRFVYGSAQSRSFPLVDDFSGFMPIDGEDAFEDLGSIPSGSVDFVIASHVIEHSPNPIAAIAAAHRVCRNGGKLILIVPNRDFTFDRRREVTSVEHLLLDFRDYNRDRDVAHYLEWHRHVLLGKGSSAQAVQDWSDGADVHYHCFIPSSFCALLSATVEIAPWSAISCWTPPAPIAEFYAVLQK